MSQPQVITIQFVPAGVELTLLALSKLPYEQVAGLMAEVHGQYQSQIAAPMPQVDEDQLIEGGTL